MESKKRVTYVLCLQLPESFTAVLESAFHGVDDRKT